VNRLRLTEQSRLNYSKNFSLVKALANCGKNRCDHVFGAFPKTGVDNVKVEKVKMSLRN
jgi:hypothetical protein